MIRFIKHKEHRGTEQRQASKTKAPSSKEITNHKIQFGTIAFSLCSLCLCVLCVCFVFRSRASAEIAQPVTTPRFETRDIFVDSHATPLAAYQFELTADPAAVQIVGVEGGEHPAFNPAPYYDPAALMHNRIIIAAFNTGHDLPTGSTRVARLHLRIISPNEPKYDLKLESAADASGNRIDAAVRMGEGETR